MLENLHTQNNPFYAHLLEFVIKESGIKLEEIIRIKTKNMDISDEDFIKYIFSKIKFDEKFTKNFINFMKDEYHHLTDEQRIEVMTLFDYVMNEPSKNAIN
jgi:hypothetical protein